MKKLVGTVVVGAVALIVALAPVSRGQADTPVAKTEFADLFNGKDLEGWDGDENYWSVQDGVITGKSTPDKPLKNNTFLIWKGGKVGDFELHVSYKISGGNSGVQYSGILYEEKGRGILAERGQKVTIDETGQKQAAPVGDSQEIVNAIKKGDWNEYVIIAHGNHIVQKINGVTTVDVTDNQTAKAAREGILALQVHSGPPMTVQFKDIRLKGLKAKP